MKRPAPEARIALVSLAPVSMALVSMALAACAGSPPVLPPGIAAPVTPAPPPAASAAVAPPPAAPDDTVLRAKLAQFVPAVITADVSALPPAEKKALDAVIAAARLLDPVFDRQAWIGNPALRADLARDATPHGALVLAYFDLMRGPWDRQDHFKPFAVERPHPPGAGFYPQDLTADAFKAYVVAHPDWKEGLESLTTLVVRDSEQLKAVRYSQAYAEWLKPAAAHLVEAAAATHNRSLARFLTSRAAALGSDEYRQSDKDWMDLDSRVEPTLGPYETYDDDLLGLKASFEAYVTVSDPVASAKLAKYKALLPDMEKNLPIPPEAHGKRGGDSPIRVVDLVYSSGEARQSVQTIAFNLPNDEVVRKEKGAKKVLLRNLIETKFDRIMRPLAEKILEPSQLGRLSSEAFFDETLFHELSHSLGPAFVKDSAGSPPPPPGHSRPQVEVRVALESSYSPIEECKADVMGAYDILYLVKRGELPRDLHDQLLVSYFAGLFRSTRFGVAEAHGQGAAVQINRFVEEGAANFDPVSKRYTVDLVKLEAAIGKLVHDLCIIEWTGDKAAADALLAKYGVMSEPMAVAMGALEGIPVDVKPIYPLAGESAPSP
jgi:Peptidase family M49